MHTLHDVVAQARAAGSDRATSSGLPPGWPSKPRLTVPGHGSVALPRAEEGLAAWLQAAPEMPLPEPEPDRQLDARALLATQPGFVVMLPTPTAEELGALGYDSVGWRRENPLRVMSAVTVDCGTTRLFGLSRCLIVENLLGFGSSSIIDHEETWFGSRDGLAEALAVRLGETVGVHVGPEPGAAEWTDVVLLLTNEASEMDLPSNWQYHLKIVAGLYRARLSIRTNAGGNARSILRDLSQEAPDALLVSSKSVPSAAHFLGAFEKARQGGYAAQLGSYESTSFEEYVVELGWRLAEFESYKAIPVVSKDATWREVSERVLALAGEHFILTKRVRDSLKSNPYPKPKRMLDHLIGLERLARRHFQGENLAGGLAQVAIRDHGVEIALHDAGMPDLTVRHCDKDHSTKPHVKVDDHKSPADCGRIYFAIDDVCGAFIVDHVGLHDYY